MGWVLQLKCTESSQHPALHVGSTLEMLCPPESLSQFDRERHLYSLEPEVLSKPEWQEWP